MKTNAGPRGELEKLENLLDGHPGGHPVDFFANVWPARVAMQGHVD